MGLPGQEYFAGAHFNPNCTWWPFAGAFIDYLNRCHYMLQQGRFVASPPNVLRRLGVEADFSYGGDEAVRLNWIHRVTREGDIYFLANDTETSAAVECSFRVAGRQPELWDPMDGSRRDAVAFTQQNRRTVVPLRFGPYGAAFVLFRRSIPEDKQGLAKSNYPRLGEAVELTGPWNVRFDPKWGGPASIVFDTLTDWTKHSEPGVKYYSGAAAYTKRFTLPPGKAAGRKRGVYLELGTVYEMAEVRLNGRSCGVVWAPPFRLDIAGALRSGENLLEVRVVNQWPNRLIGDQQLPPQERRTKTNITKFTQDSPLLPSGLLGPVTIQRSVVENESSE